jgi:hypothetical protein
MSLVYVVLLYRVNTQVLKVMGLLFDRVMNLLRVLFKQDQSVLSNLQFVLVIDEVLLLFLDIVIHEVYHPIMENTVQVGRGL